MSPRNVGGSVMAGAGLAGKGGAGMGALAIKDAVPLFSALGDETRLRLLTRLCTGGPASITQLSVKSTVSRQAITKHLVLLADAGLVESTRSGRERVWRFAPTRMDDAHRYLERISQQWDEALERLRAFVEE